MNGPEYAPTDGTPKVDPKLWEFDAASGLWLIVVGSLAFLVAIRRGLRPPVIS